MKKTPNSSTYHSKVRYNIMDENELQFGDIDDPLLFRHKNCQGRIR